jgi:hypothetical protein
MIKRSIGLHVFLFVVACVLGLKAWTSEDEPNKKPVAAELWSGRPTDLQKVEFKTEKKIVAIEPREDAAGRYYVGTIETLAAPKPAASGADAGAPKPPDPHGGHGHAEPPAEEAGTKRFISLSKGDELVKSLATLKASRVLGKVAPERLGEFGFDKTEFGTLEVVVSGKKHSLALGEKTPGGSDRYVRDPESGEAYVIAGSIANDLTSADNRLVEREFHDFGDEKVAKVVLKAGEATREIVRHKEEKDFWSKPDSPEAKDETVSNWMTKVERLRVTNYVEAPEPPVKPEDTVARIEYFNERGKSLGYFEIVRRPPPADSKERPDYLARSERSRWYATVLRSTAEQIDQDLSSVMAP